MISRAEITEFENFKNSSANSDIFPHFSKNPFASGAIRRIEAV